MTQPVGVQGFPDFQRNAPANNVQILRKDETIGGPVVYGPFFVGYTRAVNIKFKSVAGRGAILLSFFTDKTVTLDCGEQSYGIDPVGQFTAGVKVLGPWMLVEIATAAAGFHYTLNVSATDLTGIYESTTDGAVLIASGVTAIGAGANIFFRNTKTWPGAAHIMLSQLVAPWTASIFYTDINGVDIRFDTWSSITALQVRDTIYLPAYPVGVQFFNTGAGATQCQVYLAGSLSNVYGG